LVFKRLKRIVVQVVYAFGLNLYSILSGLFESQAQWTDRHRLMLDITYAENISWNWVRII